MSPETLAAVLTIVVSFGIISGVLYRMGRRVMNWIDAIDANTKATRDLAVRVTRLEGTIKQNGHT